MELRSQTHEANDHLSVDRIIEDNASALDQDGFDYLAGPVIHEDQSGQVYVTMLYRSRKQELTRARGKVTVS